MFSICLSAQIRFGEDNKVGFSGKLPRGREIKEVCKIAEEKQETYFSMVIFPLACDEGDISVISLDF